MIDQIERWQKKLYPRYGLHFVHASDEWYVLAGRELPPEEAYDGYLQLENGVGMLRLMMEEFEDAMGRLSEPGALDGRILSGTYSCVTGQISFPYIRRMADRITERFPRDPHPGLSDPQRLFRGADHGDRASHRTGYPGAAFREGTG